MSQPAYDPWVNVSTLHGFHADEIISALQKEIRRGHTENAALIAYEMYLTSADLEQYLWKRLLVISVEDIGFANPQAPVLIHHLYEMHRVYDRGEGDRLLFALQAVRYLCASQKDRSTDEMVNWMIHEVNENDLRPEIPDYAFDMHTAQGQRSGRGKRHFWEEATKLSPEWAERDQTYRQRMLTILDSMD